MAVTPLEVSIAALGVSALSFGLAALGFRRGNARLSVSGSRIAPGEDAFGMRLKVTVNNRGLAEIDIRRIGFSFGGCYFTLAADDIDGEALPVRLRPNSSVDWNLRLGAYFWAVVIDEPKLRGLSPLAYRPSERVGSTTPTIVWQLGGGRTLQQVLVYWSYRSRLRELVAVKKAIRRQLDAATG
jgi:hypothetical protein